MKIKIDPLNVLLIALISVFFIFWLVSCNPVKQVLRDEDKLQQVARVIVNGGWCANDTTYITKSDTLVKVDTLVEVYTDTEVVTLNDTTYFTKWKTKTIAKTITIRDTLKSYIVDNARVKSLQTDSTTLTIKVNEYKRKANTRLSWLISLLIIAAVYVYLKLKKK
jgi:hypothetical protein